jgi:hypothetical protein
VSAILRILSGGAGARVVELEAGTYVIGRDEEASIRIDSRLVSRKHAELKVNPDEVRIIDLGSANGTTLNDKPVVSSPVADGDRIQIGDVVLEYSADGAPSAAVDLPVTVQSRSRVRRSTQSTYVKSLFLRAVSGRGLPLRRLITGLFVLAALPVTLLSGWAFLNLYERSLSREALLRAGTLVQYLAEKNREDLRVGNELLLDVESTRREKGVVEAFLIDARGRVLAPVSHIHQAVNDPFTTEALTQPGGRPLPPSPRLPDGTYILVHPIRAYNDRGGQYETLGVARIRFSPGDAVGSLADAKRLLALALVTAVLLSLALGWVTSKILTAPLLRLADRLHRWRAGQSAKGESAPFAEWEPLFEAADRAMEDRPK